MPDPIAHADPAWQDALQGLLDGDFSRLEPLFEPEGTGASPMLAWLAAGRFDDQPVALDEMLSCACFLGKVDTARRLLERGLDPGAGMRTGMNALHWAVNRGQLAAVRLLLRHGARLETRNMYEGTALGTVVWSALHEPRASHADIVALLLQAGARTDDIARPVAHDAIEALFVQHERA